MGCRVSGPARNLCHSRNRRACSASASRQNLSASVFFAISCAPGILRLKCAQQNWTSNNGTAGRHRLWLSPESILWKAWTGMGGAGLPTTGVSRRCSQESTGTVPVCAVSLRPRRDGQREEQARADAMADRAGRVPVRIIYDPQPDPEAIRERQLKLSASTGHSAQQRSSNKRDPVPATRKNGRAPLTFRQLKKPAAHSPQVRCHNRNRQRAFPPQPWVPDRSWSRRALSCH